MKVALALFKYFPHGGLQRDFMRIACELLRRGHEVTLFTRSFQGEAPEGLKVELFKVSALTNHGKAAEFGRLFKTKAVGFDVTLTFNRIEGADFYFAADNCIMSEALSAYPAWFLKLSPRHRAIIAQERAVMSPDSPTKIFYIVEKQKRDFQKFYRTPDERFIYLPPGLNEACFRSSDACERRRKKREALGVREDELLLLLVGSFFEGKGADRLLKAAASLPEALRKKCRIALVGNMPSGPCLKLARKLQLSEKQLLLPGASSDVPDWLLAADLMVHPARKEATGTVIVEALAAGLPVIASSECGFANFAAEAGGMALELPFRQSQLDEVLAEYLESRKLAALKTAAIAYSARADFRRRAAAAVDVLEQAVHG